MNEVQQLGVRAKTRRVRGTMALVIAAIGALAASLAPPVRAQPVAPANGPRWTEPGWHALVGATLVPEPGKVVEKATIVIRHGRVESVEAGAPAPAGARVWDCAGLTIYPGLIEPYWPVDAPKPDRSKPGAHWNSLVTPERSALDGDGVTKEIREKLRHDGFTVASIAPRGGIFQGSGAVVALGEKNRDGVDPASVLSPRAFQVVSLSTAPRSARGGSEGGGGYPDSKMGSIALIRQTLADVAWYTQATATYRAQPDRAERPAPSDALDALMLPSPLAFDVADELDALRAAKIATEFGRPSIIIGSGSEYQRLGAIVKMGLPLVVPLAYPEKPAVDSPGERESVGLRELMAWEAAPTNPARLAKAGVKFALTAGKTPKDQKFVENLRLAIAAGFTEQQALAALTTVPAELLGLADRIGKVQKGMAANLVVVAKGGLFDKDREIRDLWIDGERYEIKKAPVAELEGSWNASFSLPPATGATPLTATLKIEGEKSLSFERPVTPADREREAAEKAKKQKKDDADADAKPADAPPQAPDAKPADADNARKKDETRTFKARAVSLTENRYSFLLDGPALGVDGVVTLTAVIEDSMRGSAWLPDGAPFLWTASRSPEQDKKKADDEPAIDPARFAGIPESFGLPFGPFAFDSPPAQPDEMLIRNARIWTGGRDGIIEKGEILIRKGRIAHIGQDKGGQPPRGAVVIDAGGKNITPGMIDCHSHTGISGGVNESQQAVTAEVRIADVVDPDSIAWYRELAGGLTAVNQLHGSANPIGGQNSVVKIRWGAEQPDDMKIDAALGGIKFALGENVKQSNWGDRNTSRYPQTRMGVETLIRDRFTAAREYAQRWAAWNILEAEQRGAAVQPRRDLELEALAEVLDGKRLVHCHSYRQDEILMLCRVARDFGFKIGTFQHVLEGYKVAEAIRESALGGSSFSDWWAYKFEVIDAIPANGALMHDVGVTVTFNSDSDELARRMNTEAGKAVRYGDLPREDAFNFVSLNAATQLKLEDRIGSLETGKDADFVIWSADPLSVYARCDATYIDGREYFSLERDAAMRTSDNAQRQRILQKLLAKPAKPDKAAPDSASTNSDRPGRRGPATGDLTDDLLASLTSSRGRGLVPIGAQDIEQAREHAFLHALETRFNWLTLNGQDLSTLRCGDCGSSIESLLQSH